ncbi:MAG: hypothetical protein AAF740_01680, partial [Bacteroidota bacterium]
FIYIDSSGDYLIVEPYKLIEGNDPNYVLTNFCPSITDNSQARTFGRYRKGEDFLETYKAIASLDYCTALSDTMHVRRSRNGDGTLLTSIWNPRDKFVNLYFYHDYNTSVQFNLLEELAKGDHTISVPELFPKNTDFERLISYKTPFNVVEIRFGLVIFAGLLLFLSSILVISSFRKNNSAQRPLRSFLLITALNLLLIPYLAILATHKNVFYFDAPYKHYSSDLISLSSYIPFLLLLSVIPFTMYTIKKTKSDTATFLIKATLAFNNVLYIILIMAFSYWGLVVLDI